MRAISTVQILSLTALFAVFLAVPTMADRLGSTLDSLPIRFAAVILILAAVGYDSLIALAVFLVVANLYLQHHNNDIGRILQNDDVNDSRFKKINSQIQNPSAMKDLDQGGHADVTDDIMDFMPKREMQDNEVDHAGSINEKHVLSTEQLGSKAQNFFRDEMRNAESL